MLFGKKKEKIYKWLLKVKTIAKVMYSGVYNLWKFKINGTIVLKSRMDLKYNVVRFIFYKEVL